MLPTERFSIQTHTFHHSQLAVLDHSQGSLVPVGVLRVVRASEKKGPQDVGEIPLEM